MSRTHRALAMLALGLALVGGTSAVAAGATQPTGPQDRDDQLAQRKALYRSELDHNLQQRNQSGREVLAAHGLLAQRKALYQSELERNLATAPAPAAAVGATQPAARTGPDAPSPRVDVLATLLVGLIGGLVGGAAAAIGWTATTRRRLPRAAAGT